MPNSSPNVSAKLTRKQLQELARQAGVSGWYRMCKKELLAALNAANSPAGSGAGQLPAPVPQRTVARRRDRRRKTGSAGVVDVGRGDRAAVSTGRAGQATAAVGDSVLQVRPHSTRWCEVRWSVTSDEIRRAHTALGADRRSAQTVLHLERVGNGDDRAALRAEVVEVVPVQLNDCCWFFRIPDAAACWQLRLGLQTESGRFQPIQHSPRFCPLDHLPRSERLRPSGPYWDAVKDPETDAASASGGHETNGFAGEQNDLPTPATKPISPPPDSGRFPKRQSGPLAAADPAVNAEATSPPVDLVPTLRVNGHTLPGSLIRFDGEPLPLSADGCFELELAIHDGREVLPFVIDSPDRTCRATEVLVVEFHRQSLSPQRLGSP